MTLGSAVPMQTLLPNWNCVGCIAAAQALMVKYNWKPVTHWPVA